MISGVPSPRPHPLADAAIPEDIIIPARLVLSEASMQEVADRLGADEEPSKDLKALFRD